MNDHHDGGRVHSVDGVDTPYRGEVLVRVACGRMGKRMLPIHIPG